MTVKHLLRAFLLALLALLALDAFAQDKQLHWRQLDVDARLDRDGKLHIVETHSMVFTGDWNGGERSFRTRLAEQVHLEKLSRIASDGTTRLLREGDLSAVDDYKWHDSSTLRWRSRMESDPPFANQELVYAIAYTLENSLQATGQEYLLNHDFAFPERDGVIERFTLRLKLDPAWHSSVTLPPTIERAGLPPGSSVIVRLPLRYLGAGVPVGVLIGTPVPLRQAILALFLGVVAFLAWQFFKAELRTGRFLPISVETIDGKWLEQNLFVHLPEVVGAAWDNRTAEPEVAAVLARMTCEGKLESRIEKGASRKQSELHLTLLVDRKQLTGYEASLVKSLFFNGDNTSTTLVREKYAGSGLDLVARIRKPVAKLVAQLSPGRSERRDRKRSWAPALVVLGVALVMLISTGLQAALNYFTAAVAVSILLALGVASLLGAHDFGARVINLKLHAVKVLAPLLAIIGGVVALLWGVASAVPLGFPVLLGMSLLALSCIMLTLNAARTQDSDEELQLRRKLAAAREWFKSQLRSRNPRLDDQWLPYFLAFGLGDHVDHWFRTFGKSGGQTSSDWSSASSPATSSSGSTGWTGGGGSFGGGGASGSWASAAGGLAAGISSPASSGGGSSGSSGGSSGGGGGGGW